MTLLAPWAAVLAAAIGLPTLIIFYMLKLRRTALRVSSTLLWEQATKDLHANEPLRKLRLSLLFLLQLLALASICIAIGRPAFTMPSILSDRIIIIIDRSASMNAIDPISIQSAAADPRKPPQTRLDRAKAQALRVIDQIEHSGGSSGWFSRSKSRSRAMVIGVSYDARVIAGLTSNVHTLKEAVESIQPSDQDFNIPPLLDLLRSIALQSPINSSVNADISVPQPDISVILISDGGLSQQQLHTLRPIPSITWSYLHAGSFQPHSTTPSQAQTESRNSKADIQLTDNVGIVAFSVTREQNDPAKARVFARLSNASSSRLELLVTCTVNTQPPLGQTFVLPPASIGPDQSVIPGQQIATFEIDSPGSALVTLEVHRKDALAADNTVYAVLEPIRQPRVLVVAPDSIDHQQPSADVFLLGALDACELRTLRIVDERTYEGLSQSADVLDADLQPGSDDAAKWAGYDLVIFDRVTPKTLPGLSSLSISAGLPGVINVSSPLQPSSSVSAPIPRTRLLTLQHNHPLMRDVALESIVAAPAMRINIPSPDQPMTLPDGRSAICDVLALGVGGSTAASQTIESDRTGFSGDPILVACQFRASASVPASRHAVVGFDIEHSNWGPSESFPIFIANAVAWLSGISAGESARQFTTDQPATISSPQDAQTVLLQGPIEKQIDITRSRLAGEKSILGVLDRAGLYMATPQNASGIKISPAHPIGVNMLDPAESLAISRRTLDLPSPATALDASSHPSARNAREVWHWFVSAAALLLTLEWLVYAWQTRT